MVGVSTWFYSCDFNERCANVEYLLDFLKQLQEKAPTALGRLQHIEQRIFVLLLFPQEFGKETFFNCPFCQAKRGLRREQAQIELSAAQRKLLADVKTLYAEADAAKMQLDLLQQSALFQFFDD